MLGRPQRRPSRRRLLLQPPAHQLAPPEPLAVGKPVIREQPALAPRDEPQREQLLQVSREVRLREVRRAHELAHRALAVAERVEDLQPRGLAERLEPRGDQAEQLGCHAGLAHRESPKTGRGYEGNAHLLYEYIHIYLNIQRRGIVPLPSREFPIPLPRVP